MRVLSWSKSLVGQLKRLVGSLPLCFILGGSLGILVQTLLPVQYSAVIVIRGPSFPNFGKALSRSKQSFGLGEISTDPKIEAIEFLRLKFDTGSARAFFSNRQPVIRRIDEVRGTNLLKIEVWARDPSLAKQYGEEIFEELQSYFDPRIKTFSKVKEKFMSISKQSLELTERAISAIRVSKDFNAEMKRFDLMMRQLETQKNVEEIQNIFSEEGLHNVQIIHSTHDEQPRRRFPPNMFVLPIMSGMIFVLLLLLSRYLAAERARMPFE